MTSAMTNENTTPKHPHHLFWIMQLTPPKKNPTMKILFDILPIALFFAVFKYANQNTQWAADSATNWLGLMVAGGSVGTKEAPILLATVAVILATVLQVIYLALRRKKIEPMVWIGLALAVSMGGATIYFHNETFIKLKLSMLYGLMGLGLSLGQLVWYKNGMQRLLGDKIELPATVWSRLNAAWALFFIGMACLNLGVAHFYSTEIWVDFKMFGTTGLMVVFVIAQGVYLSRHMKK